MKNFNSYVNEDIEKQYRGGSSVLGPGLGQYEPVADLNAQSEKEVKKSDLDQIEKYADRLFASLDIDVEFTRHFLDRVNDERNVKQITPSELTRLFKQTYKKHGKTIARLGPDAQAVISDMKTDINMPFVLNLKGGELELVAKTVMRKKNFKTPNRKLAFEDVNEGTYFTRTRSNKSKGQIMKKQLRTKIEPLMRDVGFKRGSYKMEPTSDASQLIITVDKSDLQKVKKTLEPIGLSRIIQVVSEDINEARAKRAVAGGKVQKLVTAHGLTYKGKKYKEIDMELVKIDNSSEVVTFNVIHPKEIFGDEVKIPFRTLRRGPFMATDTSKIWKEDKEDDRLKKIIDVATEKTKQAKQIKQMKNQHKTSIKNVRDKDQKKIRNDAFKKQIQVTKDSNKRKIKELQKEEFRLFHKKVHERITLPEPPNDTKKELETLKKIISARTSEDEESIRNHDETPFYAVEEYCKENGLKFREGELDGVVKSVAKTIKHFKKKFSRPRPFQLDKSIKPFLETETTKTRSYPSGHACQSMIVGLYVTSKYPTHREGIIKAAKKGGMTRVQAGFHFLSDYIAGVLLAEKLYPLINKNI